MLACSSEYVYLRDEKKKQWLVPSYRTSARETNRSHYRSKLENVSERSHFFIRKRSSVAFVPAFGHLHVLATFEKIYAPIFRIRWRYGRKVARAGTAKDPEIPRKWNGNAGRMNGGLSIGGVR